MARMCDYHDCSCDDTDDVLLDDIGLAELLERCNITCDDRECYNNRSVCEALDYCGDSSVDHSYSYRETLGYIDDQISFIDEAIVNHRQYIGIDSQDTTDSRNVKAIPISDQTENIVNCLVILFPKNFMYEFEIDKNISVSNLLDKVRVDCGYSKFDRFDVFHVSSEKHKQWLNHDLSIENQIRNGEWKFELKLVAALFLWKLNVRLKRIGHLSLKLYDGTYISHWPQKLRPKWTKQGNQHIRLEDDIEAEKGEPDQVLYFEGVKFFETRQDKIINWWRINESSYNLFCNNCAQMVLNALFTGKMLPNKNKITPTSVYAYVERCLKNYYKLRNLYMTEFDDLNQILIKQRDEYKELTEMDALFCESIESLKIIRELKEIYGKFADQLEILENSRDYDEYEFWRNSNTLLEKIRVSNLEITERHNQLKVFEESKQFDKITATNSLIENLRKRNELYEQLHDNIELKQDFEKRFDTNNFIVKPLKFRFKILRQLKLEIKNQEYLKIIDINKELLMQQKMLKN